MEGVSNLSLKGGGGKAGFNKMPFWIVDLLVSCGRMPDSCKKKAVSKIARFVWTGPKPAFVFDADHKMTSY